MDLKKGIKALENSAVFKEFLEINPDYYLINIFSFEEEGKGNWQAGYYSPKEDKIVSFNLDPIKKNPPEDLFKKKSIVAKLDMDKVEISVDDALDACEKLRKEKFAQHKVGKKLIILQNQKIPLYNITFITQSFNIINMKVNAKTNTIMGSSIQPAISFKQA